MMLIWPDDFVDKVIHGDCLEVMKQMPDGCVDAVVTDPPAGISFMGKDWDHHKGGRNQWIAWMITIASECLRVVKPGGHAFVWSLPRTSHWTATAWEDAGFDLKDRVAHVFATGFPKSLSVGKAIDKAAGTERQVVGKRTDRAAKPRRDIRGGNLVGGHKPAIDLSDITAPATEAAKDWEGWGTAVKPAVQDWWLLRKPLSEKNVAENVLKHGTGALNIDECRIPGLKGSGVWGSSNKHCQTGRTLNQSPEGEDYRSQPHPAGRWPANLILTIPEDEYRLRDDITPDQLHQLADWMNENAKY
jgi:site-specific DNA-methyltransferase (adenine-specific)